MHFQPPLPYLFYDDTARRLERRLLWRMALNDALVRRYWRLERVHLDEGREHYRLYFHGALIGIVDILSQACGAEVDRRLACYLAAVGFTVHNTRLIPLGARTPDTAPKYGVPTLFEAPSNRPKTHRQRIEHGRTIAVV